MPRGVYDRKGKPGGRQVRPSFVHLNWQATVEVCIVLLRQNNEENRSFALAELRAMARLADANKLTSSKVQLHPGKKKLRAAGKKGGRKNVKS